MFEWLRRLRGRSPKTLPSISADLTGFTLTIERESRGIPWQSVQKIAAYKQDLGTTDRIVLLVEVERTGETNLSLPEDCPGFSSLFGPMEQALGINPSWYLEIMTPVFEPTPTVLFMRSLEEE